MGNAFALRVNATLVEVLSFETSLRGDLLVYGWWEDGEGGRYLASMDVEDVRVMA